MIICVLGAPCSGKSTWVEERADVTEVRADFTRLAQALGGHEDHSPSDDVKAAAMVAQNATIGRIFEGLDGDAYIVRRSLAASSIEEYGEAGVRFVVLDPGLDECLDRAEVEDRPAGTEDDIRAWYDDPPEVPAEYLLEDPEALNAPRKETTMTRTLRDRFNFAKNKQKTPVLASIPENTGDEHRAVMRIYDPIDDWGDWFGLSAKEFGQALDQLPDSVDEIELHINSPGGIVHEGLAILNQLRQHKASVTVIVDGLAASAASFIAMGADKVLMAPNAELMVHNAWSFALGDTNDLRKAADDLLRINTNLARVYQSKAGGDVDDWLEAMRVETWYSDEEAVTAGLADAILRDEPDELDAAASFDLRVFAHAGRAHAPSPYIPRTASAAAGPRPAELSVTPEKEGPDMSDLIKGLRNRLGIAEAAELDNDQLLAAVDEALAERAESAPEASAARELPEGTEVIDSEVLAQLRTEAEDGRAARAEQDQARREQIVDDAIRAGKLGPARRAAWLDALEVDEAGAVADLERLTPGLIPMDQLGDAGDSVDGDEAAYNRIYGKTDKKES